MKILYLDNSQALASLLDDYPDDEYWVTKEIQGYRVSIKKPGIKPGYPKDIAVSIHFPNGSSKSPSHRMLASDFIKKCEFNSELGKVIFSELDRLQKGKEPRKKCEVEGFPGLPSKILIHALKWIWIQEDRNYPPPQYLGRRMNWATYLLIQNGNVGLKTLKGEEILKRHGYTSEEIDTIRHRSGSRNLR